MLQRSVRERRICMSIYKDNVTGKWRVVYRYTDWTGETHQPSERGRTDFHNFQILSAS